jgi:hypothetical protein
VRRSSRSLEKCSGPATVDLDIDHYEGLDFHNAFDIRAPYS